MAVLLQLLQCSHMLPLCKLLLSLRHDLAQQQLSPHSTRHVCLLPDCGRSLGSQSSPLLLSQQCLLPVQLQVL